MMKSLNLFIESIKRDKTPLVSGLFTLILLITLIKSHNWQSVAQPEMNPASVALPDFSKIQPISAKKQAFFEYLRPFVREENLRIQYDRALLMSIEEELQEGSPHHRSPIYKLKKLARRYYLEVTDIDSAISELKLRIDIVPESLVLVQAAKESAWGTSRFARKANNLFGHWCFSKGCGLVPKNRDAETRHEIRRFESPQASVISYILNLNSHSAYLQLREIRAQLREQQRPLTGVKLAQGLENYSQRRERYVDEIVNMIHQNDLE